MAPSSRAVASIRSRERELIATFAPSSVSALATARPIPLEAPVTSATRPEIPISMPPASLKVCTACAGRFERSRRGYGRLDGNHGPLRRMRCPRLEHPSGERGETPDVRDLWRTAEAGAAAPRAALHAGGTRAPRPPGASRAAPE